MEAGLLPPPGVHDPQFVALRQHEYAMGLPEVGSRRGAARTQPLLRAAEWKLVFFHHPAYTTPSSSHSASTNMRWDFQKWGAAAVLQGHNHFYERLNGSWSSSTTRRTRPPVRRTPPARICDGTSRSGEPPRCCKDTTTFTSG